MSDASRTVLLVEDEAAHAELIVRAFEAAASSVRISIVQTLREARQSIEAAVPDLVLTDFRLPDGSGTELLSADREQATFPVVVMTSHGDEQVAVEAIKAGALDYVPKSESTFADMPRVVDRALREWGHIVERRKAEEKYAQAQRLESVGRLAAGIAHDFNNMLTAINGSAALIKLELPRDHSCVELAENILHSGHRAADLVRQLLAFSRRQVIAPRVVRLNEVLSAMARLVPRVIGEDVEVVYHLAEDLPAVRIDPAQLEQVLLNLAVNARDAMRLGGKLTIGTGGIDLDPADADSLGLRGGPHVVLSVADNGSGMSPEVMARIFEPFFTTKVVGEGTGLGLSTVFGIVKQSDGAVTVDSEVGRGTTFRLYFPATTESAASGDGQPGPEEALRGTETVLVVEDDGAVRRFIQRVLEGLGYTLVLATDGESALRQLASRGERVDAMLIDIVLPGMTGVSLADAILSQHPDTPVLFMTGYSEDSIARHGVIRPGVLLLEKPFTPRVLTQHLRSILDQRTGAAG